MSVADLVAGKRVCIVAGSGGVGKTSTAAAIAMGLAAEGQRVAVVTIDPARRLAEALGVPELGNEPHRVEPERFAEAGVPMPGELWAMMLDPKQTFDELVTRLAPDDATREEILSNRIYAELSSAVAGSQEFTAIAKLYELAQDERFDVVVLDTPPSRNALDFLEAPDRLTQFLEGRAVRLLFAPTGLAARVIGRGTGVVLGVLKRVTGVDLLKDLTQFFSVLSSVMDGFQERAASVKALLVDDVTTFLVVTSPQPEPVTEAIFFREQLRLAGMPFGGLVVNRVAPGVGEPEPLDPFAVVEELTPALGAPLARKVGRAVTDAERLAERDARAIQRLRAELDVDAPVLVPLLIGDVHDVAGLARLRRHLFAPVADRERLLADPG